MPSGRFIPSKDLDNSTTLLKDLSASGEAVFVTENGKAKAVILDINRYNALMDLVEEAEAVRDQDRPAEFDCFSVRSILQSRVRRG